MKTALTYFFSLLFVLLFASVLLVSCKSKKPLKEVTETKTVNYDSIFQSRIIERNKAINDSLIIAIGAIKTERKECDSVCQIAVDRLLSQLNTKKTSGDNSSSVFYDPNKKTLNINNRVGETKSDSTNYKKLIFRTKTVYSHRDIPVDKPLPKWQLALMIIGAAAIGYFVLKITMFVRSKVPA